MGTSAGDTSCPGAISEGAALDMTKNGMSL